MSYDIYLCDPKTKEVIQDRYPTGIYGNTYNIENCELWLNLTFNYRPYFLEVFGPEGIHYLQDRTSKDTWDILTNGIKQLWPNEDITMPPLSDDPWKPLVGDAVIALKKILNLGLRAPNAVWNINN